MISVYGMGREKLECTEIYVGKVHYQELQIKFNKKFIFHSVTIGTQKSF